MLNQSAVKVNVFGQLPAATEFEAWRLWCRNLGTPEDND